MSENLWFMLRLLWLPVSLMVTMGIVAGIVKLWGKDQNNKVSIGQVIVISLFLLAVISGLISFMKAASREPMPEEYAEEIPANAYS